MEAAQALCRATSALQQLRSMYLHRYCRSRLVHQVPSLRGSVFRRKKLWGGAALPQRCECTRLSAKYRYLQSRAAPAVERCQVGLHFGRHNANACGWPATIMPTIMPVSSRHSAPQRHALSTWVWIKRKIWEKKFIVHRRSTSVRSRLIQREKGGKYL